MRIIIGGDTHGSSMQTTYLFRVAKQNKADLIIQVGDFGYWPRTAHGRSYLNSIEYLCNAKNMEFWWLDGNHEDHDTLDLMVRVQKLAGDVPPYTTYDTTARENVYPHIKYLPRGFRFELEGLRFMSYGGAYSIDRADRELGKDWFEQEVVNLEHVMSLPDEPVDVLLTHDVPYGYDFGYDELDPISLASSNSRFALLELCKKVRPRICIGGHHHRRAVYHIAFDDHVTTCHVLNCNGTFTQSWMLLDTEGLLAGGNNGL